MKTNSQLITIVALLCIIAPVCLRAAAAVSIKSAQEDIAELRYEDAREKLRHLADTTTGEEKQEALLLLATLERSSKEAEILYKEVLSIDAESREAKNATLELAKIRYAAGHYQEVVRLLDRANVCAESDEACYFEGLAAMMVKDFTTAREAFSKITRGTYSVWSSLSLAEMEMNERNTESACNRYQTLARANVNPVAMYRFAECLELQGDKSGAAATFEEIIDRFQSTPEAVLASEKLKILRTPTEPPPANSPKSQPVPTYEEGYTIQFGSFRDRQNAIKLADRIKKTLPGVRIDTDLIDYREVHRVRFGFFQTREEAQKKIDELIPSFGNELSIMKIP